MRLFGLLNELLLLLSMKYSFCCQDGFRLSFVRWGPERIVYVLMGRVAALDKDKSALMALLT